MPGAIIFYCQTRPVMIERLVRLQKAGRDSSLISFCPPSVFILTAAILFLFPRATHLAGRASCLVKWILSFFQAARGDFISGAILILIFLAAVLIAFCKLTGGANMPDYDRIFPPQTANLAWVGEGWQTKSVCHGGRSWFSDLLGIPFFFLFLQKIRINPFFLYLIGFQFYWFRFMKTT